MNNKFLLVAALILGMVTAVSGAGETLHPDKATSSNENIDFGEPRNTTFWSDLSLSLLSVTGPDNTVPGETYEFTAEPEAVETFDMNGKNRVVEFYRCVDSGCDDGSQDEFLEAKSDPFNADFAWTIEQGNSVNWDVSYTVPTEEGYYAAVAYVSDGNGNLLTDSPKKIFKVGNSDDTDTGFSHRDLHLSSTPSFTVDEQNNEVTGTLGIENTGSVDMPSTHIVEMQVRPAGSNPLSFVSGSTSVCDSDFRNNVNKEYRLDSRDSESISLTNQGVLEDGKSYTVYFLTRTGCAPSEKVQPIYNSYNAGTFTLEDDSQVSDPNEPQNVVQVSKPQLSYNDGTVTSTVHFKNEGGDMPDSDIVEMQVRPQGSAPLAFSSTTEVCDTSTPENVHKEYRLDSGESDSTNLSTSAVSEPGKYTVYLLTREGCAPDNEKVDPYFNSVRAGTVTVQDSGGGWVEIVEGNQNLFLVSGLFVLVAGGVYFRYG